MFERYAIYYTAQGAFASRGAAWLGWDVAQGQAVAHPTVGGLDIAAVTAVPRKYGFHGTLKAPFRLAEGTDEPALRDTAKMLASQLHPASAEKLEVAALGRFLALVPKGENAEFNAVAAQVVTELDGFRAPLTPDELARRRKSNLSAAQENNLQRWGYPHVLDQFRFHMTLTGRMPRADVAQVQDIAHTHFAPVLPVPFTLDAFTLAGQRADGMFVSLERYPLS